MSRTTGRFGRICAHNLCSRSGPGAPGSNVRMEYVSLLIGHPIGSMVSMGPDEPQLMTTADVAQALAVSRSTVFRLVDRGELSHIRIGHLVRFRRTDLRVYVEGAIRTRDVEQAH